MGRTAGLAGGFLAHLAVAKVRGNRVYVVLALEDTALRGQTRKFVCRAGGGTLGTDVRLRDSLD